MLKPSMRVIPVGGPAARGRLANIVMFRWLIRVKSTLPRRPRCAVSRRAAPPDAPHRSSRCRGAYTRPARWHGASARSRHAQRAITPQQWSQRAITPQLSSRLGRLYVSCAACQRSDASRPSTREGAVLPRRPRAPSAHQAHAKHAPSKRTKKGPHHEDAGPPKPAASR